MHTYFYQKKPAVKKSISLPFLLVAACSATPQRHFPIGDHFRPVPHSAPFEPVQETDAMESARRRIYDSEGTSERALPFFKPLEPSIADWFLVWPFVLRCAVNGANAVLPQTRITDVRYPHLVFPPRLSVSFGGKNFFLTGFFDQTELSILDRVLGSNGLGRQLARFPSIPSDWKSPSVKEGTRLFNNNGSLTFFYDDNQLNPFATVHDGIPWHFFTEGLGHDYGHANGIYLFRGADEAFTRKKILKSALSFGTRSGKSINDYIWDWSKSQKDEPGVGNEDVQDLIYLLDNHERKTGGKTSATQSMRRELAKLSLDARLGRHEVTERLHRVLVAYFTPGVRERLDGGHPIKQCFQILDHFFEILPLADDRELVPVCGRLFETLKAVQT